MATRQTSISELFQKARDSLESVIEIKLDSDESMLIDSHSDTHASQTHVRLSNLLLLYVHKSKTDALDLEVYISEQ